MMRVGGATSGLLRHMAHMDARARVFTRVMAK